jgi:hypothetical protein
MLVKLSTPNAISLTAVIFGKCQKVGFDCEKNEKTKKNVWH